MAQSNVADCLPTDSTKENERQPDTSRVNDASLKAEDDIHFAQDKNLAIPKDTSQSATIEYASSSGEEPTLYQLGNYILRNIRKKFLYQLGGALGQDVSWLDLLSPGPSGFSIMVKRNKKADLVWAPEPGTLPHDVASAIYRAWTRYQHLKGTERVLLESCGSTPVVQAHWCFDDFQEKLAAQRRGELTRFMVESSLIEFESQWHQWCLDAAESEQTGEGQGSADDVDTSPLPMKFRGQVSYCKLKNYKNEQHMFPLDQLASVLKNDHPFLLQPSKCHPRHLEKVFDLKRLLSFLRRDFQGGLDAYHTLDEEDCIQFQLRYFRPINERCGLKERTTYPCLLGDRERAIIGRGSAIQCLEEKRVRVTLQVSPDFPGLFNIFILADEDMSPAPGDWTPNTELIPNKSEVNWARYRLLPFGKGTAITSYLFEVFRVLERSLDAWSDALDSIDKLVRFNLSDFEDEKRVQDLMFDKSFTRSKDYFIAIQLLRITEEWLDEVLLSIDGLRDLPAAEGFILHDAQTRHNLSVSIEGMKEQATGLQTRVRKKSEEIKSLRDGLFNATSLREATKAMALNQAIYAFTVVTVLFTPVSFLATFWALPFLNNPAEEGSDMVPEPASFRSSFIAMPLLTYALVIGIAWYMRPDQGSYRLLDWLTGIWDTTQKALRTAWDSVPHERNSTWRTDQGGFDAEDHV